MQSGFGRQCISKHNKHVEVSNNMESWDYYQANVNDNIASVYLDLSLHQVAPVDEYSKVAWYWIKMENPREDGLSSDEDFDDLCSHEDELVSYLSGMKVKFVGRITTQGRREFYFYIPKESSIEEILNSFIGAEPRFLYQVGEQNDLEWGQYINVLYPGANGIAQIKGRNALQGNLKAPTKVV